MRQDQKEILLQAKIKDSLDKILKRWEFRNVSRNVSYSEKLEAGKYELLDVGKQVPNLKNEWDGTRTIVKVLGTKPTIAASFELMPMINCCGICVSTMAQVNKDYRGKGLGTLLNSFRIDLARHLGYSLLLCTDDMANVNQRTILQKNGWKDIHTFFNARTQHTVAISVIGL